eukprot:c28566_g1_i2 orf=1117-2625(+)
MLDRKRFTIDVVGNANVERSHSICAQGRVAAKINLTNLVRGDAEDITHNSFQSTTLPNVSKAVLSCDVDDIYRQTSEFIENIKESWECRFSAAGDSIPTLFGGSSAKIDTKMSNFLTLSHSILAGGSIPASASSSLFPFQPCRLILKKVPVKVTTRLPKAKTKTIWQVCLIDLKQRISKKDGQLEKQHLRKAASERGVGRVCVMKQLLCGGFAGVISRSAVAPLDLIKTHLITAHGTQGAPKSALAICQEILEQEGWKGLFRGNVVNCIRVAPNKAIELCVFEMVRRTLNKEGHPLQKLAATIAGGAAGMAGTVATYPLELIRTRLSVQPELYKGLLQTICRIAQEEGLGAFYSGLSPSLVGVFPYAATNYFVYDGLRTAYCQTTGQQNVPTIPTLYFGAVAAAASSSVTYPLEVARRHMQLCTIGANRVPKTTLGIIKEICRHEGFSALYKGIGIAWLKLVPAAGISFVCYEAARIALRVDDASLIKLQELPLEVDTEHDT